MIEPGKPLLVLLSGGADSVCLLHLALEQGADVSVLHVNYGLRPTADEDEQFCRELSLELCDLIAKRAANRQLVDLDAGNGQLERSAYPDRPQLQNVLHRPSCEW